MIFILYGKYKNIRNTTWRVLVDYNVVSLPVKLSYICDISGIILHKNSYVNMLKNSQIGLCFYDNDIWNIIYDDTMIRTRIRFTIAHELGHIFLGHSINVKHTRQFEIVSNEEEQAANIFASRLLAPACVIWGLGLQSPEEIANFCDISIESATYRFERMKELLTRKRFLSDPMEYKLYNQFLPFIERHKNK